MEVFTLATISFETWRLQETAYNSTSSRQTFEVFEDYQVALKSDDAASSRFHSGYDSAFRIQSPRDQLFRRNMPGHVASGRMSWQKVNA